MAFLPQTQVSSTNVSVVQPRGEKLFLTPHATLWMIWRHLLAWLFLFGEIKWGNVYSQYLKLSSNSLQFHRYGSNVRLLWNEITAAEISEKRDRLIFFSGFDKRITIPQLNYNKTLLKRLLGELQMHSIEVTTTKRASYLQTKGTQIEKSRS